MIRTCLKISFQSEIFKVKEILDAILTYIEINCPYISGDELFDIRLIYSELLINALIHGNKNDITKKIKIFIEINEEGVVSVIKDEGLGFDYNKVLNGNEFSNEPPVETGRGIKLVNALADWLKFNEAGNQIEFFKKLSTLSISVNS